MLHFGGEAKVLDQLFILLLFMHFIVLEGIDSSCYSSRHILYIATTSQIKAIHQ
jgi:hypothetical protein